MNRLNKKLIEKSLTKLKRILDFRNGCIETIESNTKALEQWDQELVHVFKELKDLDYDASILIPKGWAVTGVKASDKKWSDEDKDFKVGDKVLWKCDAEIVQIDKDDIDGLGYRIEYKYYTTGQPFRIWVNKKLLSDPSEPKQVYGAEDMIGFAEWLENNAWQYDDDWPTADLLKIYEDERRGKNG